MNVREVAEGWVDSMRADKNTLRLAKGCVTKYYLPLNRSDRTRLMEGNHAPLPDPIKEAENALFFEFWRVAGEILDRAVQDDS